MPTEKRMARVDRLLASRQPDLRIVLEGVAIAHNASAVMRTCDAAGVLYLDIISPNPEALAFNEAISTRADKWLEITIHASTEECLAGLKSSGFRIVATSPAEDALLYTEIDYTRPTALIFGSESGGVSPAALSLAEETIRIPMAGMVQSLNLSVSVGVILYEAFRQRKARGFYSAARLPAIEYERLRRKWLRLEGKE